LIVETDVLGQTLDRHSPSAAEKFVQEVFWRGYFKGWLEHRPEVWSRYRSAVTSQIRALDTDASLAQRYTEAVTGRTGIDCFDFWAQELRETHYLHNHARMWFASIWIFTLKLPWELGADFFYRHLLDGDAASNTCSWRWVGGLHTMGKTYLARPDNIETYTRGRFNPVGQLATQALPLTEPELGPRVPPQFDMPDLVGLRTGLLLTQEDCAPQSLEGVPEERVRCCPPPSRCRPLPARLSRARQRRLKRATRSRVFSPTRARMRQKRWSLGRASTSWTPLLPPACPKARPGAPHLRRCARPISPV
jgi:deoxyribodipyrimidine photo-lyase